MKAHILKSSLLVLILSFIGMVNTGCSGTMDFLDSNRFRTLKIVEVENSNQNPDPIVVDPDPGKDIPPETISPLHPIFEGTLGYPISASSLSAVELDPAGYSAIEDFDGDGIPNDLEDGGFTNPYVSDYPRITTRIDTPVTIELRTNNTDITQNHAETLLDSDVDNTINNCADSNQYNQFNKKTTPYEAKDTDSWSNKLAGSTGYSQGVTVGASVVVMGFGGGVTVGYNSGQNRSWDTQLSRSTSSEKTVFQDVDYVDNLNRNGIQYKNDTIERISRNFRQSGVSKSDFEIGPNAGVVRAALYIINETLNQPVNISDVTCTLSFRTPSGKCLPVKTFLLENQDGSEFNVDIYGGQEQGPYAIEVPNLNTYEVKNALRNGYVPQIHVVTYAMHITEDSNYIPGVDNLKTIEETAKSRTALIKIIGPGIREMYRVPAFEVDQEGVASPGISLKKALFHVFKSRIGAGEIWEEDADNHPLTVNNTGLKWKYGFVADPDNPDAYVYSSNTTGNVWDKFETYVKEYEEAEKNSSGLLEYRPKRIETIKRIGNLQKYNPFSTEDNPAYNAEEPLSTDEFLKLKQWVILHNGQYFNGDINDPIWAGERYEIIFYDAGDVNEKANSFYSAPLQNISEQDTTTMPGITISDPDTSESDSSSVETVFDPVQYSALQAYADFTVNTLWNREYDSRGNYSRARFLGKVSRGEVIKLEVELDEFRSLFNIGQPGKEFSQPVKMQNIGGSIWQSFNYTFDEGVTLPTGKPGSFTYTAWGGCNQIILSITQSANARSYTVSFWPQDQDESSATHIAIPPEELTINNGYVILNSTRKDTQGFDTGTISAGDYYVSVHANGVAYNVPTSVLGAAGIVPATVTSAPEGVMPSDFMVSAAGIEGGMSVHIDQAEDAEYYLAYITGPYNYGHGNGLVEGYTPSTRTLELHQGANVVAISKSDPDIIGTVGELTPEEISWEAPGVFKVTVYAVNNNCLDSNGIPDPVKIVQAQNEVQTVLVDFNRYEVQKQYRPKVQIEQFNPRDVDFEVNFGEGSGWFRLKISHDDYTTLSRDIDCRRTTSFIENRGRVTIYFTPPSGYDSPQNTDYNVFRGGAEQVEVYLRTVARPEYRDTLWLKSSDRDTYDPLDLQGYRCININSAINSLPGLDPLQYWILNENTDATMIEDFNTGDSETPTRVFPSLGDGYSAADGDFGVVAANGKEDFFFSPMKMLSYSVSASIVDVNLDAMMGEASHVDTPEYRPCAGEQKIMLSNLDSQYADSYLIGCRTKKNTTDPYWEVEVPADDDHHYYELTRVIVGSVEQNLMPNEEYQVYVAAVSGETMSSKVYMTAKTMPEAVQYALVDPGTRTHGYGVFLNGTQPITDDTGSLFVNGVNFEYDTVLNDPSGWNFFDTGTSGALAEGKLLRIVEGGRNIATYLTPVAKDLGGIVYAPPSDECYIDPARKSFVLPRPSYLSGMNNDGAITSPLIKEETPVWSRPDEANNSTFKTGGMWGGTSYYLDDASGADVKARLYPFGTNSMNYNTGTVSTWIKPGASTSFWVCLGGDYRNRVHVGYGSLGIYINNIVVTSISIPTTAIFHHLYVVWNKNGLGNGYRIKAIYDGSIVLNWAGDWEPAGTFQLVSAATGNAGGIYWDDTKVWKDVVSLTSTWDYNSGIGVQNSLHPIYGSGNGYRPALTGPNGVGFYSVPKW